MIFCLVLFFCFCCFRRRREKKQSVSKLVENFLQLNFSNESFRNNNNNNNNDNDDDNNNNNDDDDDNNSGIINTTRTTTAKNLTSQKFKFQSEETIRETNDEESGSVRNEDGLRGVFLRILVSLTR